MDSERFDRLARAFGRPRSRRSLARLLGGLGLGGALAAWGAPGTLAAERKAGEPCTRGRQCKTGRCIGVQGYKTCSCSGRYECAAGSRCVHGGCFRAESCAAECGFGTCGDGSFPDSCYCSQTVGGVPVCYANENFCTEGRECDANADCPTGRACVDVSCLSCGGASGAVCLAPCPVSP